MIKLPIRKNDYKNLKMSKFSDFIGKTDEEIRGNAFTSIELDNSALVKNNFDLLKRIFMISKANKFYSKDFALLKYIEENLQNYERVVLSLSDDFENKDRSYIEPTSFEKARIEVPFCYLLWIKDLQDNLKISLYTNKDTHNPYCSNLYENISLDNLKKIKEIINSLAYQYQNFSSLEKILLISNYLQDKVEYVKAGNIIIANPFKDTYSIPVIKNVGSPENVLLNNFGVCNGIANATTLLLNNPVMDVNTRSVSGSHHAWNYVLLNGKYYYIDNTWSITRNKNQYPDSKKARSFSKDYLLFGTDKAKKIGHHISENFTPGIEKEDFAEEKIIEVLQKLSQAYQFTDYQKPFYKYEKKFFKDHCYTRK